jgi:hypothetical protein
MNIYNKKNIINYWEKIIPKSYYKKLYDEIKFEVLNDIFRKEIVNMIDKELSEKFKGKLITDDNVNE